MKSLMKNMLNWQSINKSHDIKNEHFCCMAKIISFLFKIHVSFFFMDKESPLPANGFPFSLSDRYWNSCVYTKLFFHRLLYF